jgi:hypothetical protein
MRTAYLCGVAVACCPLAGAIDWREIHSRNWILEIPDLRWLHDEDAPQLCRRESRNPNLLVARGCGVGTCRVGRAVCDIRHHIVTYEQLGYLSAAREYIRTCRPLPRPSSVTPAHRVLH